LKKNWDLISLVDSQFDAWKKTLWDQIDPGSATQACRDMSSKQTNPQQNKDIKGYKSFQALNDRIKNMSKLLPLIEQLKSKYMQDRHWTRLMTTTCKKIDHKNPKFCLNDLLVLELHKYEADVEELVESAAKEDKIDTNIRKIIKEWDKMKFTFEEVSGIPCLGETGEIVELVEQHGMDIQGMLGQKDVAEFRETVSKWKGYMTTLENVIEKWRKVQGDWRILRPIFIESEDIKAQLPDAAATFQKVHEEFRELMFEVQEEPLVIPACTAEGRLDKLKYFETEIESCQKALNDQLESKQKIFPRFYFVSKEILLTILSNGGNPEKVNEFMGDCFDGMNFVKFQETAERPYRIVNGMESKDGEEAPWHHTIKLEGAPEQYMLEVEKGMQKTLIIDLENAKADVERWIPTDLPREIWLEYYNSQTVLLTTQIVWTEETISAFDEVEAGAEGAMKDNYVRIVERINKLIDRTLDLTLSAELRTKIIIIITVDVHGRDVVNEFVIKKTQDSTDFMWQKQLKFGMDKNPMRKDDPKQEHNYAVINICDW
jgi:dynein heavy chain